MHHAHMIPSKTQTHIYYGPKRLDISHTPLLVDKLIAYLLLAGVHEHSATDKHNNIHP